MNTQAVNNTGNEIQVAFDFICPWCWIGGENLDRALAVTELAADSPITFVPYLLNPDMPVEGLDRKAYRSAKFGSWARSQAMDAQVTYAGQAVGLTFDYERAEKTPNTLAGHRLVWREQQAGREASTLVNAIFKAYFGEGRDIGRLDVLADIAAETGLDRAETLAFLQSAEGVAEVLNLDVATKASGVRSVPSIQVGDEVICGAQPVAVMTQVLRQFQISSIHSTPGALS